MSLIRPAIVPALLCAVVLSGGGGGALAGGSVASATEARPDALWKSYPLQQGAPPETTRTVADGGTTTVAAAGASGSDEAGLNGRSTLVTVLLVAVGALIGVVIGLIPALLVGMLLGVVTLPRRRARAEDLLVEPPRAARPVAEPELELELADEREWGAVAAVPPPEPLRAHDDPAPPRRVPAVRREPVPEGRAGSRTAAAAAADRGRHGALYDAEYAKQLDRLDALRAAISTEVAVPAAPPPEPRPRRRPSTPRRPQD
jgi:hypothetical protein